jgi:type III secretion system YscQ/HrcQ family protein
MRTSLSLRKLDPEYCALNNARLAKDWRDEIVVDHLSPDTHYLGLRSQLDGLSCMAWLPLQRAIDFWLGNTAIPAEQIGPDLALAFARDAFAEQPLPAILSILEWESPSEIVDGRGDRRPRYRVAGASVELFLDRLPTREPAGAAPLPDLSVSVQQRFGPIVLTAQEIAGMAAGDVVLIDRRQGRFLACGHTIFCFSIHGDHIMLSAPDDTQDHHHEHPGETADTSAPALHALPVPISFILSTRNMPLSELAALRPGTTLALANNTPMVTLTAGGQTIAKGELVRIGEVLAVEISEVTLRPGGSAAGEPE